MWIGVGKGETDTGKTFVSEKIKSTEININNNLDEKTIQINRRKQPYMFL